jgi:hypothetical protein
VETCSDIAPHWRVVGILLPFHRRFSAFELGKSVRESAKTQQNFIGVNGTFHMYKNKVPAFCG